MCMRLTGVPECLRKVLTIEAARAAAVAQGWPSGDISLADEQSGEVMRGLWIMHPWGKMIVIDPATPEESATGHERSHDGGEYQGI